MEFYNYISIKITIYNKQMLIKFPCSVGQGRLMGRSTSGKRGGGRGIDSAAIGVKNSDSGFDSWFGVLNVFH